MHRLLHKGIILRVRRTRWRLVFGRFRIGHQGQTQYRQGALALPFLLLQWITRNPRSR